MTQFKENDVFIVSLARTPIGGLSGSLSSLTATQLGSQAIQEAVKRASLDMSTIDEVYMGNVLQANVGQAPATQAMIGAGISANVPSTTINKVCASGMKAVMLAAQSIELCQSHVIVAGGMESMSNTPYYLPKARSGFKYGNQEIVDGIIKDGLLDPYHQYQMGVAADNCGVEHNISRAEQDQYAIASYKKAQHAHANRLFAEELFPIELPGQRGKPNTVVSVDDEVSRLDEEKLLKSRPAFSETGTVTAANASSISDGAAALVLMSGKQVNSLQLKPIARIVSYADAAQVPEKFTTTPSIAIPKALKRGQLTLDQIDLFEINEAFSVVALANCKLLNIPTEKVNIFGGGVALGHPLGCSGARVICTLISALRHSKKRLGCAAVCNGGGGASAVVIECL